MSLAFQVIPGRWAVCRFPADAPMPAWAAGSFVSITRTPDELSVVCRQDAVPTGTQAEFDWSCLQLQGPFPFHLTGILASFLNPLAAANVPIFALSTYDTDWVLIPSSRLHGAIHALEAAGHHCTSL